MSDNKKDNSDFLKLSDQQKIIYSQEMSDLIKDEIEDAISELPIGGMVSKTIEKQFEKVRSSFMNDSLKLKSEFGDSHSSLKKEFGESTQGLQKKFDLLNGELKDKYKELKNNILASHDRYTFGGFGIPYGINEANKSLTVDPTGKFLLWSTASVTFPISIANGGTGQTSQTSAFDALAPTTTQGDLIYYNGTDNIRLAKGTALQQIRMNAGATAPEWATISSGGSAENVFIFMGTPNGFGAVNTTVRRFTVFNDQGGTDIEYTSTVNDGSAATIQTAGLYSIEYIGEYSSAAVPSFYITRNSTDLNTDQSTSTMLCVNNAAVNSVGSMNSTVYCAVNDVLRAQSNTAAKPNSTLDITQFIVRLISRA